MPVSPRNASVSDAKVLREKWLTHIQASPYRPVLIVEEAQEMNGSVCSELRRFSRGELAFLFAAL